MATLYGSIQIPFDSSLSHEERTKKENEALKRILEPFKKRRPNDDLVGKTIRFPVADGHAVYAVVSSFPLRLCHIDVGDGWRVASETIRGLRIADVRRRAGDGL